MARQKSNTAKLQDRRDQIMDSVKTVHCKVVDLAEDLIEGTVTTGAKYQKVAVNAIKKSEPIIEKQVDLVFDSMEMFVDQVQSNSKRLQKLLGITKQVDMATERIGKMVKMVSGRVEEGIDEAEKTIKTTFRQGKKEAEKAVKTVKAEAKKVSKSVAREVKAAPKRKVGRPRKTTATK